MKRSEMIKKLGLTVSRLAGGMLTSKEIEKAASNLLKVCEDAGMLPPIEPTRTESDLDLGVPEWEEE